MRVEISKALSDQEWREIRDKGWTWKLDDAHRVVLTDTNGRSTGGRSIKQAFVALKARS